VQSKIAILAKLAFGQTVSVSSIPTIGISSISKVDFDYAKHLNSTIKLLGTAVWNADDHSLAVFVSPTVVPLTSPLSAAKGPGNMVVVQSENLATSTFAGPGAGRFPTANSVVNDLVRIAQRKSLLAFPLTQSLTINSDYQGRFYVRLSCTNRIGIVR
jgi:homoserine dehydrogenase